MIRVPNSRGLLQTVNSVMRPSLLISHAAVAMATTADYYYTAGMDMRHTMWTLSEQGVSMYSVDGATLLKSLPNDEICRAYESRGSTTHNCDFKDAVCMRPLNPRPKRPLMRSLGAC